MDNRKSENANSRAGVPGSKVGYKEFAASLQMDKSIFLRILAFIESHWFFRRGGLIFIFALLMSILVFFQIDLRTHHKLGEVIGADIISPITFEFVDHAATLDKKLKAEAQVPLVFDYDTNIYDRLAVNVYKAFRNMRLALKDAPMLLGANRAAADSAAKGRFELMKDSFEKDLSVKIDKDLFEWLLDHKFSVNIENYLLKTAEYWYQKKLIVDLDRTIPAQQNEVVARVVHRSGVGRESTIPKKDLVDLNEVDFLEWDTSATDENFPEGQKPYLVALAQALISPNLTLNKQEIATRKSQARDSIIPVTISFRKGQPVVHKDSVLQPSHLNLIGKIENVQSERKRNFMVIFMALFICLSLVVVYSFMKNLAPSFRALSSKDILVSMMLSLLTVATTKVFLFVAEAAFVQKFAGWLTSNMFLFAGPVAAGSMLVALLTQSFPLTLLFTLVTSLSLSVMEDFSLIFFALAFLGGLVGGEGVSHCKKRNDIYQAGLKVGLVNAAIVLCLAAILQADLKFNWLEVTGTVVGAFLGGFMSSVVTMILIPVLESMFSYTTDVKLLELSNLNHPLMREMIVKAPGTYHHSMMVGSMVEAAADEIGANSLLGKVMCYYHDIGKIPHANYFIENQRTGENPHDHISPFMSKTILIAHVKDGAEMAREYKLGQPIIDGILQHHGTTLISFFYNKALDMAGEGEENKIPEAEFRYPGQKPQFREAALCMLADSIEAAARSLDEPTPTRLQNIVKNIIQRKFTDGQLDECNLTLKDISKVEHAFTRILLGIYHQRIDYPRQAGGSLGDLTPLKSLS